ncbi:MAG: DUF4445 domain-containing protein [Clostridiales bacterium]|nr:DUF4445 domain-containing protein [Clostridiales bacterium]
MNPVKVTFKPQDITATVEEGKTIMEALIAAGLKIDAPCGGRGVCGKCKVKIIQGSEEKTVLACQTMIKEDMTVDISGQNVGHRILMGGTTRETKLGPAVYAIQITVPKPTTSDLRSCWDRTKQAVSDKTGLDIEAIPANSYAASRLYHTLETNNYTVDVIMFENEIIDVKSPDEPVLGIAYDIGTTTVAAYLIDLRNGRELVSSSTLNPQVKYGADVIMRTKYAIEENLEDLTADIQQALSELCDTCLQKVDKRSEHVYLAAIVGNTCMHHLYMGISPASLAFAPYTPAITESIIVRAFEYGLKINAAAKLMMLPNIAGFVGADTVGASLAAEMDIKDDLTLLIDIGTNGEMVLGNKNRLIACSTAAGPAFEGAVITFGMRGAQGAIDHVSFSDGKIQYSVIGDVAPLGICGSGIVDLVSELVRVGIVDSGGRLLMGDEIQSEEGKKYTGYIDTVNGLRCIVLADEKISQNGENIVFTQKDVREIQLAKGAMAAGIGMLAKKLNVDVDAISQIMIAGAFGSFMLPKSACGISLIPPALEKKVMAIGNAAGQGAKLTILNHMEFKRAHAIALKIEYLELAADPEFQDVFIDQLEFPSAE